MENGKEITIQPFYFSSKTKKILIDWEHSEYKSIEKFHIINYDVVPKLIEMCKECFSEGNKDF